MILTATQAQNQRKKKKKKKLIQSCITMPMGNTEVVGDTQVPVTEVGLGSIMGIEAEGILFVETEARIHLVMMANRQSVPYVGQLCIGLRTVSTRLSAKVMTILLMIPVLF